ncbi:ubiquitin-conjugating enzyme E2, other [Blastomyces silverae]|uniref:Ubiquitin-conjugating enzyme E2, other n=1 Tax=Blastomyces silverae TaxID=2060906 RepID=A0A0H1BWX1_9EURO|nr:ubiquitin-conjugating enzyme E2, other [Blastomyces silverae]
MSSSKLPNIPSLRKQQLRLEFASLKSAPPPGVYVNISATDPAFWSGVIFVQKGPYASAILRFQLRFPSTYPDLPPLVTFTTDIFHPLIVPLTTYTFSTNSPDTDTVSATDEERLPPGGFSLRHGFPHWFGRARRSASNSATQSRNVSGSDQSGTKPTALEQQQSSQGTSESTPDAPPTNPGTSSASGLDASSAGRVSSHDSHGRVSPLPTGSPYASSLQANVPVLKVLNYIRSTFDDEAVLDSIPLEAAGNPGAWHAWRSHRGLGYREGEDGVDASVKKGNLQARRPGEWNWEGVWETRVQAGIETSYLESVLFGNSTRSGASDDLIRFVKLDNDTLTKTKEEIISTQGISTQEGGEIETA